jgi:hypothetical protein
MEVDMRRLLGTLFCALLFPGLAAAQSFCVECLKIRVGRPYIARGPDATKVVENPFHEIALAGGGYRGFSAQRDSYAIDGSTPWSMGATPVAVLTRTTNPASWADCGWWLNDTTRVSGVLYGYAHTENMGGNNCDYSQFKPNKSMTLVSSTDDGLHWSTIGRIITGRDSFTDGSKETGEGDCTVVSATTNNYIYCRRAADFVTIVAKAPMSNPSGGWVKFYDPGATDSRTATVTAGAWSEPGLGGHATPIVDQFGRPVGTGASTYLVGGVKNVMLLGHDISTSFKGIKMSFSSDMVHFTRVDEPLLPLDDFVWSPRPASSELIAYPSAVDNADGDDTWSTQFMLTSMYLEPKDATATDGLFTQRFLVFRDVYVTLMGSPQVPQVGVALSRWSSSNDRWSTTAPVPGNFSTYTYEGDFGYLLTQPDPNKATTELVECISTWPGASDPDHVLTSNDCDTGSSQIRLRTAGWVYSGAQTGTHAIYRCYSSALKTHFVSDQSDCEGLGSMEWRLGYALDN